MRVDIFCESGTHYGLGHFYRCVKLIAQLITLYKSHSPIDMIVLHNRGDFCPPPLTDMLECGTLPTIECKNYEWLSTQPEMLDIAIIDSYESQEWFYYRLKSHSKALICFDDMLRDVYPPKSYILNPASCAAQYFANKDYYLWCGEGYIIPPLMTQIAQDSHLSHINAHKKNVLINFGGADSTNLSQDLLSSLATCADSMALIEHYHFHIVLGSAYSHTLHIPPSLPKDTNAFLSVHSALLPRDFIALACACDYAISAGGGTMLELLYVKIPSIIIESAQNQHLQIQTYLQKGAIVSAKSPLGALSLLQKWRTTHATQFIRDSLMRLELGAALIPSLQNLIATINAHDTLDSVATSPKDSKNIESNALTAIPFTQLNQEQSCFVLEIRNQPQIAQWMYTESISEDAHNAFLSRLKDDYSKRYWLFKYYDEYIGVGSLSRIHLTHKHAFIGIYINPNAKTRHKGRMIISFLESFAFDTLSLHTLHLEVLSHNARAIRFYEKCGYIYEGTLKQFIYNKTSQSHHDIVLMYKIHKNQ